MAEPTLRDALNAVVTLTGAVGRLEKGQPTTSPVGPNARPHGAVSATAATRILGESA